MADKRVLAFDFGASSGRAMLGEWKGGKIELREIHRFSNDPVFVGETLYWDILRLFHEIKQAIIIAVREGGFDSIGIDTWGVDFGLLDKRDSFFRTLLTTVIYALTVKTNWLRYRFRRYIHTAVFNFFDLTLFISSIIFSARKKKL